MKGLLRIIDRMCEFFEQWDKLISRVMYIATGILFILWSMPFLDSADPFFRIASLNMIARWGMTVFGCISIAYGLFKKDFIRENSQGMICPLCEKTFSFGILRILKSLVCPECKIELEPLEGFYDRYPELKELEEDLPDEIEDIK
ncbi:hypothetical protein [Maridesulfovibrio frigidus]|uniref:hypothetical protein n=1 Tax=Maridesulfovibrio frigidus TaxID=340956 RepID=UPI0004E18C32|nr:hypothetical protein [Maridesulfovibrio frigidus]